MTVSPLILVSASGVVTHANRAAVDVLGEPAGRRCSEYVRARDGRDSGICTQTCVASLGREREGVRERDQARVRAKPYRMVCTAMGPQTVVELLPASPAPAQVIPLTPRELEVMGHVAQGKTTSVIARSLAISPATVRTHVEHAREKLGARTRAEAVARLAGASR